MALDDLLTTLLPNPPVGDRTAVLGIDGRSAAGKTTLAARIAARRLHTAVVHSDDLAWHHSRFGWVDLLVDHVVRPAKRGESVGFRPPAWQRHGRSGQIDIGRDCRLLVVEGVGVGRAELRPWLDALIWVETPMPVAEDRDLARISAGTGAANEQHLRAWLAEEDPFLATHRPWRFADVVVAGVSVVPHDPVTHVTVLETPKIDDDWTPRPT